MRTPARILTAVAVAGIAFAASAAYTGTGLSTNAGATKFVGGSVTQTVTGATLQTVTYSYSDAAQTAVNGVTLNFADLASEGKTAAVVLTAAAGTVTLVCPAIASQASACTLPALTDPVAGVSAAQVTVS